MKSSLLMECLDKGKEVCYQPMKGVRFKTVLIR